MKDACTQVISAPKISCFQRHDMLGRKLNLSPKIKIAEKFLSERKRFLPDFCGDLFYFKYKVLVLTLPTDFKYQQGSNFLWYVIYISLDLELVYSFDVRSTLIKWGILLFRTKQMQYISVIDLMFNCLNWHNFFRPIPNLYQTVLICFALLSFPINPFAIHLESIIFGDCKVTISNTKENYQQFERTIN